MNENPRELQRQINAERQRAYKKRMREAGLVQVQLWVPVEAKATLLKHHRKWIEEAKARKDSTAAAERKESPVIIAE